MSVTGLPKIWVTISAILHDDPRDQLGYKRLSLKIWPGPIPAWEPSRKKQALGQPGTSNPNAAAGTVCDYLASPHGQMRRHRQIPALIAHCAS